MKELFNDYPDVVTVTDLQTMLHIGRNTAYQLCKTNRIENIKIGSKYLIPKTNVINFLKV